MIHTDTLAQVGFRARRIECAEAEERATKVDLAVAAQQCTTFLDQCAFEAEMGRWFPMPIEFRKRSVVIERVYEALREHGPLTAREIMPIIGHQRSAAEKALRELVATGRARVVGKAPTMGRPHIYAAVLDAN